jgi:hypothetical protein
MAALDEDAWYFAASTVSVELGARAADFRLLPLLTAGLLFWIAPGAMVDLVVLFVVAWGTLWWGESCLCWIEKELQARKPSLEWKKKRFILCCSI